MLIKTIALVVATCTILYSKGQGFNSLKTVKSINSINLDADLIHNTEKENKSQPVDNVGYVSPLDEESSADHNNLLASVEIEDRHSLTMRNKARFELTSPLKSLVTTSPFGYRYHPISKKRMFHSGVDLRASQDTVYSMLSGTILASGYDKLLGYYVKTEHENGVHVIYGHLSQFFHKPGEIVKSGVPLGITGNTGRSTAEHLHLTVKIEGKAVDPKKFIEQIAKYNLSI